MKYLIRKAKSSDAKGIALVQKKGWIFAHVSEEYDITEKDILTFLGSDEELEERFRKYIESGSPYYIVEIDGKVKGYTGCYKEDDYWTGGIYLDPSIVGKDIGVQLFERMLEDLETGDVFLAMVAEYNTRSRRFFEKLGFELQKETKELPLKGTNKVIPLVVMKKIIN